MAFNKYYQDELSYLRDMGSEFSRQNPGLAKFLSEEGNDPDVERLFEGVSFLTGRLRQKLDDELPEVTHALLGLLWPHYLRPLPSMSVLEFKPIENALIEGKRIARGEEVQSVEVENTSCRFRSCYDVDVYPIELQQVTATNQSDGASLTLDFQLEPGAASENMGLDTLRLFLHGDREMHISQGLYLWLFRYLDQVELTVQLRSGEQTKVRLGSKAVSPVGFADDEALLPYSNRSFNGYRLLQEYFSLPEKFLFVDIKHLGEHLQQPMIESFSLKFLFNRQFDSQLRLQKNHIRLFCTPIINLFSADADPIRVDHRRLEYMVRPSHDNQEHIELFSIDHVSGNQRGQSKRYDYPPFESFDHEIRSDSTDKQVFYSLRRRLSTLQSGLDSYISFVHVDSQNTVPPTETISLELTCTNRKLSEVLRAGDIIYPTADSVEFASFRNITRVTNSLQPPLREGLHWQLISQMALHYRSLSRLDSLRTLLACYDFRAFFDRQAERASQQMLEGIQSISTETRDRIIKGVPVRALQTKLQLRESKFGAKGIQGESTMFLFASVLNGFFSQYANINAHHELEVEGLDNGEIYRWQIQSGQHFLL
ncbi:MAG: type VI secretion system baseplate subunit TssF [Amphritea sp.]|nr:type VI secretion system baseplate subunit TssF [Amphritea sp.]MBQ0784360.1 type VI secretion system baseplate subunit TssF [Amphritea sp.]